MELISIIIPVYNVEEYLSDCIESVLMQTYYNIEVLIIDDGSTDKSQNIVRKYLDKDKRIRFFTQKNMGASVARNKGIKESKGNFILFFDADDILEVDAIKILYEEIKSNNVDLVIGAWNNIDENNNILPIHDIKNKELHGKRKAYLSKELLSYTFFDPVPSNKIYRKDIIEKNNIRFAEVAIGQDLNFFLKYVMHCGKIIIINKNVFKYRIRSGSISRTYSLKIKEITNSFEDVFNNYSKFNKLNEYKNELNSWKVHHLNWQINKIRLIDKKVDRLKIINNFEDNTKDILKSQMINNMEKENYIKLKLKYRLKKIYSSNLYCNLYKYFNKK